MRHTKEEFLNYLESNPTKVGLLYFYEGLNRELMLGENHDVLNMISPRFKVSVISYNEDGEELYDVYCIYRVKDSWTWNKNKEEDFFIKFYGYYRSHEGANYTGFKEVTPTTKTIEVFE